MKKSLLAFGIVIILFGGVGIGGSVVIYYQIIPYLDEFPSKIDQYFSDTTPILDDTIQIFDDTILMSEDAATFLNEAIQTSDSTVVLIEENKVKISEIADEINITIQGSYPLGPVADSFRDVAGLMDRISGEIGTFARSLETMSGNIGAIEGDLRSFRTQMESARLQIENTRLLIAEQIAQLRNIVTIIFAYLAVLHSMFIVIGISLVIISVQR